MTTKAQKIRVGIFMMVTLALLGLVLVVFGGVRIFQKEKSFHIVFAGSVMGLEKGAPVHLNGMRVGRVDAIKAAPGDLQKVLVTITVKAEVPVHTDTKAILAFAGITGLKVIDLRDGTHTAPMLPEGGMIAEGETILDKLEKQAKTIVDQSGQIMANANRVVENLVVLTDPKKFEGIDEVIANARTISKNLTATSSTLQATSGTLQAVVNENRAVIKSSLANVDAATKSIEVAARSAATMMDVQIAGLIGKAGAFIGGLEGMVKGNDGQLRAAVADLRQASRNFKELSRDLKQKPSRILFSDSASERKLP